MYIEWVCVWWLTGCQMGHSSSLKYRHRTPFILYSFTSTVSWQLDPLPFRICSCSGMVPFLEKYWSFHDVQFNLWFWKICILPLLWTERCKICINILKIFNIRIRVTLNFTVIVISMHLIFCPLSTRMNNHLSSGSVLPCKTSFDSQMKCIKSTPNPWIGIRKNNKNRKAVRCNNCGNVNVNHISTVFCGLFPISCFCSVLLNSEIIPSFPRLFVDRECNFQIASICSSSKLLKQLLMESLRNQNC